MAGLRFDSGLFGVYLCGRWERTAADGGGCCAENGRVRDAALGKERVGRAEK